MSTNFDDAYYAKAMDSATPSTLPLIRRSSYLADALRAMQSSGQTIRSPAELVARLLADAITQHASNKSMDKLRDAQTADQASLANLHFGGLPGLDGTPAPQASGPSLADAINPPPQPQSAPIQQNPLPDIQPAQRGLSPIERQGISMGPDELKALAQTVSGEARGEGPQGQQAVAATILNRVNQSGQPVQNVVSAPHQFEGYNQQAKSLDMSSPQLQTIMGNLQPLLNGQTPDPTNGATNFYSPGAQAAMGRPAPKWDDGSGQQIGNQLFFGGQGAPQSAPQAPQMAQGSPPPIQAPQPYQIASNGPTPPPPMQQPPGAPASAPPLPAPSGGAVPPALAPSAGAGGSASIPAGPGPTPQEIQQINTWKADQRTLPLAMQLADKIRQRMAAPMEAPKNMMWDPKTGRAVPIPGTEYTQLAGSSPSDAVQRDPFGQVSHSSIPGVQGAIPEGMMRDPTTGAYSKVPTQQQQTFRIPGAAGSYVMGPDGTPKKVADDEYGPTQLAELRNTVLKSDQYTQYDASNAAWNAMLDLYHQNPNGMRAYALLDTFARTINPGAVARVGTIQAIQEAKGVPESVRAWVSNLKGDGNVPPQTAANLIQAAQPFVSAHYRSVNALNQSNSEYAKRHGINPEDVSAPLEAPTPFSGGQNGQQQPGGPGSGPNAGGGSGANPAALAERAAKQAELDHLLALRRQRDAVRGGR